LGTLSAQSRGAKSLAKGLLWERGECEMLQSKFYTMVASIDLISDLQL